MGCADLGFPHDVPIPRGSISNPNTLLRLETPMLPTDTGPLPKTSASGNTKADDQCITNARPAETNKDGVQGEGNYEAAREFS